MFIIFFILLLFFLNSAFTFDDLRRFSISVYYIFYRQGVIIVTFSVFLCQYYWINFKLCFLYKNKQLQKASNFLYITMKFFWLWSFFNTLFNIKMQFRDSILGLRCFLKTICRKVYGLQITSVVFKCSFKW